MRELRDAINNFLNCSSSQWGVGAKSAAYFLGNSIKVITCDGNGWVVELEMDAQQMEQKHQQTGNAYQGQVHGRNKGDLDSSPFKAELDSLPQIRKAVVEAEKGRHFSCFLITTDAPEQYLLDAVRGKQAKDGRDIVWPLADVYHRVLHGPYGRDDTLNKRHDVTWMVPTISLAYFCQQTARWRVNDLKDVKDNPHSVYKSSHDGSTFRCAVGFTKPRRKNEVPTASDRAEARVEVMYYPKKWESDTHPNLIRAAELESKRLEEKRQEGQNSRSRAAAGRGVASQQPAQLQLSKDDAKDAHVIEEAEKLRKDVNSQFWNGRLIPIPEDSHKLLWFMDAVRNVKDLPFAEWKEALGRVHFSVFFAHPVLTDRVKTKFSQPLIEWMNDESKHGRTREEFSIDPKGDKSKCTRNRSLKDCFREQMKLWMQLDEHYRFDENDVINELDDEGCVHFTKVRLSSERVVEQGDLLLIDVKGKEPTFIRALCIRRKITTEEYNGRRERERGNEGTVIGYIEPPHKEEAGQSGLFNIQASMQHLLSSQLLTTRPRMDLKHAPHRLKEFSLRQVNKQASEVEVNRQYQLALKKAADTYPTHMAVYLLLAHNVWEEVEYDQEMQFRVGDRRDFPGSSVLALTANKDAEQLPVPVGGEKVKQCTYILDYGRKKARGVKREAGVTEQRRAGSGRATNSRAGQIARRIPRVASREEKEQTEEKANEERKQDEPEVRYSSSGRRIRQPSHVVEDIRQNNERGGKRRADEAGGTQRKRRRADGDNRGGGGDGDDGEEMTVEEQDDIVEVWRAHPPRELVEKGEHVSDVLTAQDAADMLRGTLQRTNESVNGFTDKRFLAVGRHQVEFSMLKRAVDGDRAHVPPVTIDVRVFPEVPQSVQLANNEPLAVRLGQPASEPVRLAIHDKFHNAITPSAMRGWKGGEVCTLRMWCDGHPQLKVSADSDKLVPHESSDQYRITGLKIEPSEEQKADELMLDIDQPLTCCIELTPPDAAVGEESEPIVIKQQLRLLPGEPQQLVDDFPATVALVNGDEFPEFGLRYVDAFGKTAALLDTADAPVVSVWVEDREGRVEGWAKTAIEAQPMKESGEFSSAALHLPALFVQPSILGDLMTARREQQEQQGVPDEQRRHGQPTFAVHLQVTAGREVLLHKECLVLLDGRLRPSWLLVGTKPDFSDVSAKIALQLQAKPNADIPLLLHAADDCGYLPSLDHNPELPPDNVPWRENLLPPLRKAVRISVSELVDSSGRPFECGLNQLEESGLLPELKCPQRVESRRLMCEVTVEYDEAQLPEGETEGLDEARLHEDLHFLTTRLPLRAQFVVEVLPGKPHQWSASMPSSMRVDQRWKDAVQIFAVDEFGNRVSIPKSIPLPRVSLTAVIPVTDSSAEGETEYKQVDEADRAMQDSVQPQPSESSRSEGKDGEANDDEDRYEMVRLKEAEVVGMPKSSDDDEVQVDEWTHFECPKAHVIMRPGPASLTVYSQDSDTLLTSTPVDFSVEVGEPWGARAWLKDRTTGEELRLANPQHGRLRSSSSVAVEGEEVEATSGLFVVPARIKFAQLVVQLLDRNRNVIEPTAEQLSRLVVAVDNGALFSLPDGEALQEGQAYAPYIVAEAEPQGKRCVFPPFVCIYSKGTDDSQQSQAAGERDEEEEYRSARMHLKVELLDNDDPAQPGSELLDLKLGLCLLPYSVRKIDTATLYNGGRADELERYRQLLNPAVISNLKLEEADVAGDELILAGIPAPDIEVLLPQEKNNSWLTYELPRPDPSSLSIEWAFEGKRCHLQYQPAIYDESNESYRFKPAVGESKEEEQGAAVAEDADLAPVGRFGKLDKAGKWSYCVTYTEKRPRLAEVLTDRARRYNVIEEVLPSVPHSLRLQRSDDGGATLPIVSNSESGNRIIARNVRLFIVDRYGSAVNLPLMSDALRQALSNPDVSVEPVEERPAGSVPAEARRRHPPRFRIGQPELNFELHCLESPMVSVIASPEEKEADSGQYAVHFRLPEPFAAQFHCGLRFFFSNERQMLEERRVEEQARGERKQRLLQELLQAQAALVAAADELKETDKSIAELRRRRDRLDSDGHGVITTLRMILQQPLGQQVLPINPNELEPLLHQWRAHDDALSAPHPLSSLDQQLAAALHALQARRVDLPAVLHTGGRHDPLTLKAHNTPLDREGDGFYGAVGSFCTVEDQRECRIISFHFNQRLAMYLVRDYYCHAKRVLEANATRANRLLDVMYEEGDAGYMLPPLPHTRLPAPAQQHIPGRPVYVFSLLHFHEPDEQLRAVHRRAVLNIVRNTMVMNSIDDMQHYSRLLSTYRISVPDILTLRELKQRFANNRERLGPGTSAPPLAHLRPRIGVRSVAVERLMAAVQQARAQVEAVIRETTDLRQQWAESEWSDKQAQQQRALEETKQKRTRLEAELRMLAEQVGLEAAVVPATDVLLAPSARSTNHRRRFPRR